MIVGSASDKTIFEQCIHINASSPKQHRHCPENDKRRHSSIQTHTTHTHRDRRTDTQTDRPIAIDCKHDVWNWSLAPARVCSLCKVWPLQGAMLSREGTRYTLSLAMHTLPMKLASYMSLRYCACNEWFNMCRSSVQDWHGTTEGGWKCKVKLHCAGVTYQNDKNKDGGCGFRRSGLRISM
jgi:hypothetical protein